ncbi:MAG TPA: DUF2207 domain-containing protein [Acidobacteriota bacterium]|nr:DUF2207 domain-containing protein [Acidobacteriota bacterium]
MRIRLIFFLTAFACLGSGAQRVSAKSLEISHFYSEIWVQQEGDILVTETITLRFTGSWNGIYRLIPFRYRTPLDRNFTLKLRLLSVSNESAQPYRYEQGKENHYQKIKVWIPEAADTSKTVIFRYQALNALQFFEAHDELYWNVTGDEWDIPIQDARATVHLPDAVTGLRTVAFTGAYGSREQAASITTDGNRIEIRGQRPLQIHEGLTVALAWNPGVVKRPTFAEKLFDMLTRNAIFVLPLLAFVAMLNLWKTRGKDPRKNPITAQYEPPPDLTPAAAGTLLDNYPHMRDLTASLVDLAVRGYLRIEEFEEDQLLGLWSHQSYRFVRMKQPSDWQKLKPYERRILEGIFDGGQAEITNLSSLEKKFYKELPKIRDAIFDELLQLQLYLKRPDKVRTFYMVIAVIIGVATTALGAAAASFFEIDPVRVILAGITTAIITGVFGWFMPARTRKGTRILEQVLGFEEFLSKVESDQYKRLITGPEMFEKYLPYAMALGVEEKWAAAFESLYKQQPQWYSTTSHGAFNSRALIASLGQLATRTGAAFASSPRSSGGSGFSGGGGSSGGGFGGGGGGGF